MIPAEQALAAQARTELAALAHSDRAWVAPITFTGQACSDVLVVGGGQSGLAIAHGLRRDGVYNVTVLDARSTGEEGVWKYSARISHWNAISNDDADIRVETPRHVFHLDHMISATGYALDLAAHPRIRLRCLRQHGSALHLDQRPQARVATTASRS